MKPASIAGFSVLMRVLSIFIFRIYPFSCAFIR
jgi:hypothetical protein